MCYWRRPVCVTCKTDMHPEKNGVPFIEQYNDGTGIKPYKVWESDMWKCPICGISVLVGFGKSGIECHDQAFEASLARAAEDPWTVVEEIKPR